MSTNTTQKKTVHEPIIWTSAVGTPLEDFLKIAKGVGHEYVIYVQDSAGDNKSVWSCAQVDLVGCFNTFSPSYYFGRVQPIELAITFGFNDQGLSPVQSNTDKRDSHLEFVDAQKMKEQHPTTFEAPTHEELQNLKVGDVVKVCAFNERFWTIIQKIEGDMIVAQVAHELYTDELEVNDEVQFHKNNIFQIANESKEDSLQTH